CINDDDDPRSQKLAVFRAPAAPWQTTLPGGPEDSNDYHYAIHGMRYEHLAIFMAMYQRIHCYH
ncbi:hypothetical protein PUZ01_003557, partial [Enterobacter cloacae]